MMIVTCIDDYINRDSAATIGSSGAKQQRCRMATAAEAMDCHAILWLSL
jgi:hypothetical protein